MRFVGPLALVVLALVFFAPLLLHPTHVLYSDHSDLLAEHVPAKRFLVGAYHEDGELPRWCPYLFAGMPFLHDIQVGAFYPPHAVLYCLSEESVGPALSWLIVVHLVVAGWFAYAYARANGLDRGPALIAATGYMFAGRWMLHLLGAGHYITVALAWLPLALLCLERAVRHGGFYSATAAGLVYGMSALGTHPQWTFYVGLFLAAWTLGTAVYDTDVPLRWGLLRWIAAGAWTAFLAVGVAMVQLLPTLELAAHSTRSGGVDLGGLIAGGVRTMRFLIGPSLTAEPFELEWEDRGGFGLLWLAAAIAAPLLRPTDARTRYRFGVLVAMFLFAFGGSVLLQWLPGFRLFRQHSRMLIVATFPVAFLAGVTAQTLWNATVQERSVLRARCRWVLLGVLVVLGLSTGLFAVRLGWIENHPLRSHPYWLSLLLTVPTAWWLLSGRLCRPTHFALAACLLLVDLWAIARPLVRVRSEADVFAVSESVRFLADRRPIPAGRVLDRDTADHAASPLGRGAPMAMLHRIEAVRGYTPLDLLRFKEYLLFLMDRDLPLRPLMQDDDVIRALPALAPNADDSQRSDRVAIRGLTYPVMQHVPIRNRALLDLLQVRFLLQPADEPLPGPGWQGVFVDPHPRCYDLHAGIRELPPYKVIENLTVMDRVFVVPHAEPLPDRSQVLAALAKTDFHRTVLLEPVGAEPAPVGGDPTVPHRREARLVSYRPNEVVVRVADGPAGYLVFADVWFPGWTCTVNGKAHAVHRANYLFRGVAIGSGELEVVFRFEPTSLVWGRNLTFGTLAVVGCVSLLWLVSQRIRRRTA